MTIEKTSKRSNFTTFYTKKGASGPYMKAHSAIAVFFNNILVYGYVITPIQESVKPVLPRFLKI